jgi:nucleoid DNA-binding protein
MAEKDMPRKAVVDSVASENDLSKVEAERLVRSVLSAVAEGLAERGRFHIAEIGSVSVAERPPRRYFNPRTRKQAVSDGDVSLKINISKGMRKRLSRK